MGITKALLCLTWYLPWLLLTIAFLLRGEKSFWCGAKFSLGIVRILCWSFIFFTREIWVMIFCRKWGWSWQSFEIWNGRIENSTFGDFRHLQTVEYFSCSSRCRTSFSQVLRGFGTRVLGSLLDALACLLQKSQLDNEFSHQSWRFHHLRFGKSSQWYLLSHGKVGGKRPSQVHWRF